MSNARVLSYGGGLDSWVMLLDAVARKELPDACVFVDVSDGTAYRDGVDPGEWPGTYRHLREVVMPFCEREGIEFVWLDSGEFPVRDAKSLFAWLEARKQIPVAGPARICTTIAKVERFEAWMDSRYAGMEVEVWIGFEAGEEKRAASDPNAGKVRKLSNLGHRARRVNRFPLMERGLCRCRCEAIARASGHPIPRKSACVFCPYGTKGDWQTLDRELPVLFMQAARLEANKPPTSAGKKLSIMGFRTFKNGAPKRTRLRVLRDSADVAYSAPTLREFVQGTYRPRPEPCEVCGAAVRASKVVGCDYLEESVA